MLQQVKDLVVIGLYNILWKQGMMRFYVGADHM